MFKQLSQIAVMTVFLIGLLLVNLSGVHAQNDQTEVVMVYASWSVVSRDLRPVAKEIAEVHKFPYVELDIDNDKTAIILNKLGLQMPSQTPYVAVIRNGKIIFTQAYPNATPKRLQDDLTNLLSQYL